MLRLGKDANPHSSRSRKRRFASSQSTKLVRPSRTAAIRSASTSPCHCGEGTSSGRLERSSQRRSIRASFSEVLMCSMEKSVLNVCLLRKAALITSLHQVAEDSSQQVCLPMVRPTILPWLHPAPAQPLRRWLPIEPNEPLMASTSGSAHQAAALTAFFILISAWSRIDSYAFIHVWSNSRGDASPSTNRSATNTARRRVLARAN
jgi:hypothetical protein